MRELQLPRIRCLLVQLLACLLMARTEHEIFMQRYSADPSPFVAEGRVWITTSHDLQNQHGYQMTDYNGLSSDDLVNWRDEGIVFSMNMTSWGKYAWAQQVVQIPNGTFVMVFPSVGPNSSGVGIAASPNAAGPYVDQLGGPIMPGDDPTIFVDKKTGLTHLCSNNKGGPFCGVLDNDLTSWKIPPDVLADFSGDASRDKQWFEAPWLAEIDGVYYMSYMMNQNCSTGSDMLNDTCAGGPCATDDCAHAHYGFDIGYAMSTISPTTGYTFQGSLQWAAPFACGGPFCHNMSIVNLSQCHRSGGDNNHQGMFEYPPASGNHYFAYHTRKLSKERSQYLGYQRNIALDRVHVNTTDKRLLPVTATPSWLRPVKYLDPFAATPAFTMAGNSIGIDTELCEDPDGPVNSHISSYREVHRAAAAKLLNVGHTTHGGYIYVRHVDFGKVANPDTAQILNIRVATPMDGVAIQIRSTSNTGQLLAICPIPNTGGWQTWVTTSCSVQDQISGIVDQLYFVFDCAICDSSVVNLHWWQFVGGSTSGANPPAAAVRVSIRARGAAGLYLQVDRGDGKVVADGTDPTSPLMQFVLHDNEDGSWSISSQGAGGAFLCAESDGSIALSISTSGCTSFRLQPTLDSSWSVQAYSNRDADATGGWMVANPDGTLVATAANVNPRGLELDSGRFDIVESYIK